MKKAFNVSVSICLLMGIGSILQAQENSLSPAFKESTIGELSTRLNDFYVEPDVAEKTSEYLSKQLKAGHFDSNTTLEAFAESLTKEVQSISKDKHLLIRPMIQSQAQENSIQGIFERHMRRLDQARNGTGGFKEAKILEGNVGYLDIRSFAQPQIGTAFADNYMQLLSNSDAIIIDLRENGGGYPEMVQYLCSYFFDKRVHLNSLYWRQGDRTDEFWTLGEVKGKKLPDVPLFVLTSGRTFSGAEEFSYNMQTQKRATLVGQTTRGGANPGRIMRLNGKLEAIVPVGKAVNPITKTNWEGVGVIPEVKTSPEETLAKAHGMAKAAGKEFSTRVKQTQLALTSDLTKSLESYDPKTGEESIHENLMKCEQAGLLDRIMINGIGYEYLMNFEKPKVAEAIFKANTLLFPEVANVFDSYAEALASNGKFKQAAVNYQKAIDIAKATNDPELKLFKVNLEKLKARILQNSTDLPKEKAIQPKQPESRLTDVDPGVEQKMDIEERLGNQDAPEVKPALLRFEQGVRSILEDSKGHYWFGSWSEGVARFDGEKLTYFTVEDGLDRNQVRNVFEDRNGTIWLNTGDGICSYDGKKITNHTNRDYNSKDDWKLGAADLWFGEDDGRPKNDLEGQPGVYRYDGEKLTFLTFRLPMSRGIDWEYKCTGIARGKGGRIWFATYGSVIGYDGHSFTIINNQSGGFDGAAKTDLHVRAIFEDSKGRLWIGNNGIGVLLQEDGETINFTQKHGLGSTENRRGGPLPGDAENGSPSLDRVFAIGEDRDRNIWFGLQGTQGYGAWRYDGKTLRHFTEKDGLTSKHISVIYRDKHGDLWLGGDGVFKFNGKSFDRIH